jgi:CRISPR/Cas system-associated exonuclease Cas4 (RecB family)
MSRTTFLSKTAENIWSAHQGNLEDVLILTPNRRTMLFFKKALAEVAGRPVWAPQCYTLDSWVKSQVQLEVPDELVLVMHLHRCWLDMGREEHFERFYSLGQQLIRDFNALDEALVDTKRFFKDLSEIPVLDDAFIEEVEPGLADLVEHIGKSDRSFRIAEVWQNIEELYTRFNNALIEKNLAYPGMLYRCCAGLEKDGSVFPAAYAIGFYKLTKADEKIIGQIPGIELVSPYFSEELRGQLKWETPIQQGKQNLSMQFVELEAENVSFDVFGVNGRQQQLQGLTHLLGGKTSEEISKTMVLLPEQAILLPMLQTIPEEVKELNVSMGLSVLDTRVYTLVQSYLGCLEAWNYSGTYIKSAPFFNFMRHPLLQTFVKLVPALEKEAIESLYLEKNKVWHLLPEAWQFLLLPVKQSEVLERCLAVLALVNEHITEELDKAALYPLYVRLQKLDRVMQMESEHDWSAAFFARFLRRILQHTRITLSGEPLKGLQVLGLPESANLACEHLIILDANEGVLPMVRHQSMLPYSLLKMYGVPGLTEQSSVQEHLFWSACVGAKKVSIFYSVDSEGGNAAEPSRWVQRLLMGLHPVPWRVFQRSLKLASDNIRPTQVKITSNEEVRMQVRDWLQTKRFSASALNTWLICRLKFYLNYVAGFKEKNALKEDPEVNKVGEIVHAALQNLLEPYKGKELSKESLSVIRQQLELVVKQVYMNQLRIPEYKYDQMPHRLYGEAMVAMVEQMLAFDEARPGAMIDILEEVCSKEYDAGQVKVTLYGVIDRIDRMGEGYRIVDYKTGKLNTKKIEIDEEKLWLRDGKNNKEALQVMFYALLFTRMFPDRPLPELHLFFSRQVDKKKDTLVGIKDNIDPAFALKSFERGLQAQINEMLSEDLVIDQTDKEHNCTYCPYASMCGRL